MGRIYTNIPKNILDLVEIIVPEVPDKFYPLYGHFWDEHRTIALFEEHDIGHITITRRIIPNQEEILAHVPDTYWSLGGFEDLKPTPVVTYQRVDKPYRGHGICQKMLIATNNFFKKTYDTPLYSDTRFINHIQEGRMGIIPWKGLEKAGLAIKVPRQGLQRWRMR